MNKHRANKLPQYRLKGADHRQDARVPTILMGWCMYCYHAALAQ